MRIDAYEFSFANRVFTAWNSLPASVVDAANFNIFRKRLNAVNLSHYYVIILTVHVCSIMFSLSACFYWCTAVQYISIICNSSMVLNCRSIVFMTLGVRISVFGPACPVGFLQ